MSGEKTEKATPKKRNEERKKGNIPQSKEVTTIVSLVIVFNTIKIFISYAISVIQKTMKDYIALMAEIETFDYNTAKEILIDAALVFLTVPLPILLVACLVGVITTGSQIKFKVAFKKIAFKMSNINVLKGIQKMFALKGFVELIKSLAKVTVLTIIAYNTIMKNLDKILLLYDMTNVSITLSLVGQIILSIVNSILPIFIFLAIFDYGYQWYEHEKNMKMSKQEIKEEYKNMEGDPQIKGKIKQKQQMMAQRRMMQAVPEADVIIRNPTHFAIAIKYDPQKYDAPIVLAKGIDNVALKIVKIAEENDVMTYEDKPLARELYENVEVGQLIPPDFYTLVSQVIIFVYNAKNKTLLK